MISRFIHNRLITKKRIKVNCNQRLINIILNQLVGIYYTNAVVFNNANNTFGNPAVLCGCVIALKHVRFWTNRANRHDRSSLVIKRPRVNFVLPILNLFNILTRIFYSCYLWVICLLFFISLSFWFCFVTIFIFFIPIDRYM